MPRESITNTQFKKILKDGQDAEIAYKKAEEDFLKPDTEGDHTKLDRELEMMARKIQAGEDPEKVKQEIETAHRALEYITQLSKEGAGDGKIIEALAGIDLDEAWVIRETFLKKHKEEPYYAPLCDPKEINGTPDHLVYHPILCSLAGVDSERAWEIREDSLKMGSAGDADLMMSLAKSLIGLDIPKAWEMRKKLWGPELLVSIAGLNSTKAQNIREQEITRQGSNEFSFSIIGINSTDTDEYREKEENFNMGVLPQALSIKGVDNRIAKKIRERIKKYEHFDYLLVSLSGLDIGWDIREQILRLIEKEKGRKTRNNMEEIYTPEKTLPFLIESLNGLNSQKAEKFRIRIKKLIIEKVYNQHKKNELLGLLTISAFGGVEGVAIRKGQSYN